MKRLIVCLAGMLALGTLQADTFFSLEKAPAVLNAAIRPNQDVDLKLEENASAGYIWTAVYDARVCTVSIKHERPEFPAPDGSGGYADIEIEPVAANPFSVTLNYVNPSVPNAAPAKTIRVNVTVGAAYGAAANPQTVVTAAVPQAQTQTVQSAPVQTQPAGNVPVLYDDQMFRFDSVPTDVQTSLAVGQDIDFDLEEKPRENIYWQLVKYDARICRVKLEHDRGGLLKRPKAEIEIDGVAPGTTIVEFTAGIGANAKVFRCHVTVR